MKAVHIALSGSITRLLLGIFVFLGSFGILLLVMVIAHPLRNTTFFYDGYTSGYLYEHGWPLTYLVREGPPYSINRWAIGTAVRGCHFSNLLIDFAVAILISAFATRLTFILLKRLQFSLATSLIGLLCVAVAFAHSHKIASQNNLVREVAHDLRLAGADVQLSTGVLECLGGRVSAGAIALESVRCSFPSDATTANRIKQAIDLCPECVEITADDDVARNGLEYLASIKECRHLFVSSFGDYTITAKLVPTVKELQWLDLSCLHAVTYPSIKQVLGDVQLPESLRILRLTGLSITDHDLHNICNGPSLKVLSIAYSNHPAENRITAAGLRQIAHLRGLKVLILDLHDVCLEDLSFVSELRTLETLAVPGAQFSGESSLQPLQMLRRLRSLDLRDCRSVNESVATLLSLDALEEIYVGNTDLTVNSTNSLRKRFIVRQ